MISRYTRPEMGRIWEDENRYAKWLKVEIAACEAMAEEGLIPLEAVQNISKKAAFSYGDSKGSFRPGPTLYIK